MNYRSILLTLLTLLALGINTNAQNSRKLEKANTLFCQLAFAEAQKIYLEILQDGNDPDPIIFFNLGETYRLQDQPEQAVTYYGRSVQYTDNSPLDYLYYAQALQEMKRYDEANKWYKKFNEARPDDSRGWRGMQATSNYKVLQDNPLNYEVVNATVVNSEASDITPAYFEDDGIIFASDRDAKDYSNKVFQWTGRGFYNMYISRENGYNDLTEPELLKGVNFEYHDGAPTISQDQNLMIYTQTQRKAEEDDGGCGREIYNLKLVQSWWKEDDQEFGKATDEAFVNINDKNYVYTHPSLSADGKRLYFVSDNENLPGHKGATDIYYATFENGKWSKPINLGDRVNSEGEEVFPYIDENDILYWSSDANLGNGGLGGLDIYRAEYDSTTGKFNHVTNMGAPINSSRDDLSLIMRESKRGIDRGYFVSSRNGGNGLDDIYAFRPKLPIYLKIIAIDICLDEPIEGVDIAWYEGDKLMDEGITDENGTYFNEDLIMRNRNYRATGTYAGVTESVDFTSYGADNGDTIIVEIPFRNFTAGGSVYNKFNGERIPDASVYLISGKDTLDAVRTDNQGNYSFGLEADKDYELYAGKYGYSPVSKFFSTKDRDCGLVDIDLYLEPSALTHVYYYFDKANVKRYDEAKKDLNKLASYLKENPTYKVELRAHTDARATYAYNERLSQRRAQSAYDYLIDAGIDKSRLTPVGYGEYCPTNKCVDGVSCNEVQHQRNRRTEMFVLNYEGLVLKSNENPRWTSDDNKFVEGGKYFDGKGSNWQQDENFEGEHGNWRNLPVRKNCKDKYFSSDAGQSSEEGVEESVIDMEVDPAMQYQISVPKNETTDLIKPKLMNIGQVSESVEDAGNYYIGSFSSVEDLGYAMKSLHDLGITDASIVMAVN